MKKILIAATIIVLAVVVVVQALRIRRLNPPETYEYTFREDIDLDYFDPNAVKAYYDTGYESGSFAREMWKNRGLNVRMPDSDDASNRVAVIRYNHLLAYTDSLGARLANSKKLKASGYTNYDIRRLQQEETTLDLIKLEKRFGASELKLGDKNKGVFELQAILIAQGYVMPHDGYFWGETETAVKAFQTKAKLFASGIANEETLKALIR